MPTSQLAQHSCEQAGQRNHSSPFPACTGIGGRCHQRPPPNPLQPTADSTRDTLPQVVTRESGETEELSPWMTQQQVGAAVRHAHDVGLGSARADVPARDLGNILQYVSHTQCPVHDIRHVLHKDAPQVMLRQS